MRHAPTTGPLVPSTQRLDKAERLLTGWHLPRHGFRHRDGLRAILKRPSRDLPYETRLAVIAAERFTADYLGMGRERRYTDWVEAGGTAGMQIPVTNR
jgi:hypothetical protein